MELKFDKKTLRYIALLLFAVIAGYWCLSDTERVMSVINGLVGILSPFIVGAVLAFIINVPMRAFENLFRFVKHKTFRRVIALVLTLLCLAIVLTGVLLLLVPGVTSAYNSLGDNIQIFFTSAENNIEAFMNENPQVEAFLMEQIRNYLPETEFGEGAEITDAFNLAYLGQVATEFVEYWLPGVVQDFIQDKIQSVFPQAFSAIGSFISGIFSAFVSVAFAIYALFEKETLARQGRKILYALIPEKASDNIVRILRLSNATFSNFLSGQCVEVCILGLMFAVAMWIFNLGREFIPLISVLIAVTAFIPIVGAWIGCIVGALLILINTMNTDPLQAVWFVIMFLALQQIEGNLIYPRVVGNSVGLSGMWVLVAVAFGGQVMGVVGMFIMIPVASVLYTVVREFINGRLTNRTVDEQKLTPQPPELSAYLIKKQKKKKKEAPQTAEADSAPLQEEASAQPQTAETEGSVES